MEINSQDIFSTTANRLIKLDQLLLSNKFLRFVWSKYRLYQGPCAFALFTCLSIVIGVLVVCLTYPTKKNIKCEFTFIRSVKSQTGYNSHPKHAAATDFNHDGNQDIIIANSGTDDLSLFLGYGNGSFADKLSHQLADRSQPYAVDIGDFNKDNHSDVVIANYGTNSIGILFGDGHGYFRKQNMISLGSSRPIYLVVGNLNQDDQIDIVVVNSGTLTVMILTGYNNGLFRIETTIYMGYDSIPTSLFIVDFNHDQKFDIAVVNSNTNEFVLLLANGNQTFQSIQCSTGKNSHPNSLAVSDFNKDGQLDIAITQSGTNNIGIYFGYNNGTQFKTILLSTGIRFRPSFIRVVDLDNDTYLDLVVIDTTYEKMNVFKGGNNGSFSLITTYSTGIASSPSAIVIADVDNDHLPDVVITNNGTNSITILTKYITYPNTQQTYYPTGSDSEPSKVAVGDFNHDHHLDIIVIYDQRTSIDIYINSGNGSFENQMIYDILIQSEYNSLSIADLNNDTHLDIVISVHNTSEIFTLFGNGNGTFRFGKIYSIGNNSSPLSVTIGLLNDDMYFDIVTANLNTNSIGIFFGYGNGDFMEVKTLYIGNNTGPACVYIGDVNRDNISDIVTANLEGSSISILIGYGNGLFYDPIIILTVDDNPMYIILGDVNQDRQMDIIYTSTTSATIAVLLGNENGTFEHVSKYFTGYGSFPRSAILCDFNNDTLIDIVVINSFDNNIGVLLGLGNGSFAMQKIYPLQGVLYPQYIAFGDFNDDKQVDFVLSNALLDNIGIILVYYEENFTKETSYSTGSGSHPYSLAIGDLNNDKQVELVVANSGNDNIEILSDYDQGIFLKKVQYSTGFNSRPQFVVIADFNQDDRKDIPVANVLSETISIFYNLGNDTYDVPISLFLGSGSSPRSIAIGDFNSDNRSDLVIADYGTDQIAVFIAYNYVTFVNYTIYKRELVPVVKHIVAGDFNNDHQWDIIVPDENYGNIAVYLGYGNRTFAKPLVHSTGSDSSPVFIAVGYLNKDKNLDIVIINSGSNNIDVYLGNGNGSFGIRTPYSANDSSIPSSVALGDFNSDNITDIVVAYSAIDSIGIFLGNGNGTFTMEPLHKLPDESRPSCVIVNDANNDHIQDIIVANMNEETISIFSRTNNGTLKNIVTYVLDDGAQPSSIAVGDFNKDGWMDIAVPEYERNSIGIMTTISNGNLENIAHYIIHQAVVMQSIYVADINNDTNLDVIVICFDGENGTIYIIYGFGDGNFTMPTVYSTPRFSGPTSIAIVDFDNDGRMDFAISNYVKGNIFLMFQQTYQQFVTPWLFSTGTGSRPIFVMTSDFNNDYNIDIAVANSATNSIDIRLGIGDGTFYPQKTYSTGKNSRPCAMSVGDFNNDAQLDIVVVNSDGNNILILFGDVDGNFSYGLTYSTGSSSVPSSIITMDLNKDNRLDIIIGNFAANKILVFLGAQNGTFRDAQSYSVDYNAHPQSIAIVDVNNDGLLDIAVANSNADYIEILLRPCS